MGARSGCRWQLGRAKKSKGDGTRVDLAPVVVAVAVLTPKPQPDRLHSGKKRGEE